jgi:hypothetical protein
MQATLTQAAIYVRVRLKVVAGHRAAVAGRICVDPAAIAQQLHDLRDAVILDLDVASVGRQPPSPPRTNPGIFGVVNGIVSQNRVRDVSDEDWIRARVFLRGVIEMIVLHEVSSILLGYWSCRIWSSSASLSGFAQFHSPT